MEQIRISNAEWIDLWQGLSVMVDEYCLTVLARVEGETTELHDGKIADLEFKNSQMQLQVDRFRAKHKNRVSAQSTFTMEIMAILLDNVVTLQQIHREVYTGCDCLFCTLTEMSAKACIEMVKILSNAIITEE